jgi:hypothetical protein
LAQPVLFESVCRQTRLCLFSLLFSLIFIQNSSDNLAN